MNNPNLYLSLLLGLSMALMPYIVSKTIAFGVRIPSNEFKNPFLRKLRVIWVIINILIFASVGYFDLIDFMNQTSSIWIVLLLAYNIIVFILFNALVKKYKAKQNWSVSTKVIVPIVKDQKKFGPRYLSFYLIIIIVTQLITVYYEVFSFQLLTEQLMATLIFGVAALTGARSRKQISSVAPVQSLFVVTNFRYRVLLSLSVLGYILVSMMGLQYFRNIEMVTKGMYDQILVVVFIIYLIIFVNMLYAGNKRNRSEVETDLLEHNDDKYWKLGLFYFNRQDSSIFVEKRNSIGWTVNLGNKYVALFFLGLAIFYIVIGNLGG